MSSPSLTVEVCLPFRLVATRCRFQAPDPPGGPPGLPVNGLSANVSTVLNRTMAARSGAYRDRTGDLRLANIRLLAAETAGGGVARAPGQVANQPARACR